MMKSLVSIQRGMIPTWWTPMLSHFLLFNTKKQNLPLRKFPNAPLCPAAPGLCSPQTQPIQLQIGKECICLLYLQRKYYLLSLSAQAPLVLVSSVYTGVFILLSSSQLSGEFDFKSCREHTNAGSTVDNQHLCWHHHSEMYCGYTTSSPGCPNFVCCLCLYPLAAGPVSNKYEVSSWCISA